MFSEISMFRETVRHSFRHINLPFVLNPEDDVAENKKLSFSKKIKKLIFFQKM